jgi:hypothetical protein
VWRPSHGQPRNCFVASQACGFRSYFLPPVTDGVISKTETGACVLLYDYLSRESCSRDAMRACRPALRAELKSKLDAADDGGEDA